MAVLVAAIRRLQPDSSDGVNRGVSRKFTIQNELGTDESLVRHGVRFFRTYRPPHEQIFQRFTTWNDFDDAGPGSQCRLKHRRYFRLSLDVDNPVFAHLTKRDSVAPHRVGEGARDAGQRDLDPANVGSQE